MEFPALFKCADEASNQSQAAYLRLIRCEYGMLVLAAILSMGFWKHPIYFVFSALILIGSLATLLFRTQKRPEQDWYQCRALAESVKTSAWRFMMRADPFDSPEHPTAAAAFRGHLKAILVSNKHIGAKIAGAEEASDQTTPDMNQVWDLSWPDRRALYIANRIKDQRAWYIKKAGWNKKAASYWTRLCVIVYGLAVIMSLLRIAYPNWRFLPIEPLIVTAASIIGWMQIKKFNELASAYTLTAHEIGLTQGELETVNSEADLSRLVNEVELVFSREHTQWVARQNR